MSGPPKDITPSELWLRLTEMPRPSKVVDFPRTKPDGTPIGQLAMWVLTIEEQMIAVAAAEKFAKDHLKEGRRDELGYESLYSNALAVEILFRACRDESDLKQTAFPTPKQIREQLSTEECARLFDHYTTIQLELGPIVTQMEEGELDAWIQRIAEAKSSFPLDLCSSELQRTLLITMASRLASSRTDTSSVGSQPAETT